MSDETGPAGYKPNLTQRLVSRLAGPSGAVERESREWTARCPSCMNFMSVWEMGGIRYRAISKGRRLRMTCRTCGETSIQEVTHRPSPSATDG